MLMRHSTCTWQAAVYALWLSALLAASTVSAAALQVPKLELHKWNRAYKLSVSNFTREQHPFLLSPDCSDTGFDTDPATVQLGACFYRQDPGGTYSYWIKKPGDWREDTNCYCYALNVYKGGFCIPGITNPEIDAAIKSRETFTCDLLRQAVLYDGAKEVTREVATSSQPPTGHYIALMVRSSSCNPYHCWRNDFHAARKDADGYWTWKEPGGPASDRDLFGNKISDPSIAELPGHYDQFCGFFWVDTATLTIGGVFTEPTLQDLVNYYKQQPGVQASAVALPYNPSKDGAYDAKSQQQLEEDLLWESKRGTKAWDDFYKSQQTGNLNTGSSDDPIVTPINLNSGQNNLGQVNIDPSYGRVNVNAGLGPTNAGNLGNLRGSVGSPTPPDDHAISLRSSSSSSPSNIAAVVTALPGSSSNNVSSSTPVLLSTAGSGSGIGTAGSSTAGSSTASNSTPGSLKPNPGTPGGGGIGGGSSGKSSGSPGPATAALIRSMVSTSPPQVQQQQPLPRSNPGAAAGTGGGISSSSSSGGGGSDGSRVYDTSAAVFQSIGNSGRVLPAPPAAAAASSKDTAAVLQAADASGQQLLRSNLPASSNSSSRKGSNLPASPRLQPQLPAGSGPLQPTAAKITPAVAAAGGRRELRHKVLLRSKR